MLLDLIKLALCVPLVICMAAMVYCVFTAFRCLVVIAGMRKEGVRLLRAMAYHNMLFKPSLYEPEASQWLDRYHRCLIGTLPLFVAAAAIGLLIRWLNGLAD